MSTIEREELARFAESYRSQLPTEFFHNCDAIEASLEKGLWPKAVRTRRITKSGLSSAVLIAILDELHLFLCTKSPRYAEVKRTGKILTKTAIPAIGGYVAGNLGIPIATATGAVAFVALAVLRVGVGAFCRISAGAKEGPT